MNYPIKINILGINYESTDPKIFIQNKIIFLGNIPKNIETNILKFNKSSSPAILKKYYGPNWNKLLEISYNKKGGQSEDIDFDNIDFDKLLVPEEEVVEISISDTDSFIIYNTDIHIYSKDNIKNIKDKIFLATGIQYYKQHLFYKNNLNINKILGYQFMIDTNIINVNINNINYNNKLLNIPIDTIVYNNHKNIKIINTEFTTLLDDFYQFDGELYMISIDEFIDKQKMKSHIENILYADIEQKELLYYSFVLKYFPQISSIEVFEEYIINEKNIQYSYPDLYSSKELKDIYNNEKQIIDYNNETIINKSFINNFKSCLTYTKIIINSKEDYNFLNIRNVFDQIEIINVPNLNYIKCCILLDKKILNFTKINNNISILDKHIKLPFNTILLSINIVEDKYKIYQHLNKQLHLIIQSNGKYYIEITWSEDFLITKDILFVLLKKYINPVLTHINNFNSIFSNINKLVLINELNFELNLMSSVLYYEKNISIEGFKKFKSILHSYVDANIFQYKNEELLDLIINKGITSYPISNMDTIYTNLSNYFQYLIDPGTKSKWYRIYDSKILSIKHNFNSIRFEIKNINYDETLYIYDLIYKLFYKHEQSLLIKSETSINEGKFNDISMLKQIDPVLYGFKTNDNNTNVYSRLCQKPFQPKIIKKTDIKNKKIKNAVKYWNFTKNTEEYYYCPDKKNPYIKFLTGLHPNNYCLPCCKKKLRETPDYKSCLNNYEYTDEKELITRYVLKYSNTGNIANRIIDLPNSLDKLLNKSTTDNNKMYIYGLIPQNYNFLENIGLVLILADILNLSFGQYIEFISKFLSNNNTLFNILMNGNLIEYFKNMNELVLTINQTFLKNKIIINGFNQWNDLFQEIMSYNNINFIQFEDINGKIEFVIPKNIHNVDQLYKKDNLYLFIIKINNRYYPIYNINIQKYHSVKKIEYKLFDNNHIVVKLINNMVTNMIDPDIKNIKLFDLNNLIQFINKNNKYKINTLYIDNLNKCYAVLLSINNKYIYLSIESSEYINLKYNSTFSIFNYKKYTLDIKNIISFIQDYNKYSSSKININKFIQLDNNIIGIQLNNLYNCYIYPFLKNTSVIKIYNDNKKTKLFNGELLYQNILYHPYDINNTILNNYNSKFTDKNNFYSESIYQKYLYKLFVFEFINYLYKYTNTELRKIIVEYIHKTNNDDLTILVSTFSNYKNKLYELINNSLDKFKNTSIVNESYIEIIEIIHIYLNNNMNKNELVELMNNTRFQFDNIYIEELKKLDQIDIKNKLYKISKNFISIGNINNNNENNNYILPCYLNNSNKLNYCNKQKLIMTQDKYDILIDILSFDISNPFKQDYILSNFFTNNLIIDFLKFKKNINEKILID